MKRLAIIVFILACTAFLANSVLLGVRVYKGVKLTQASKAFSASPSQAKKRILVVGDAAGTGIGAVRPPDSIAGRISREFPSTEVRNRSRPGATASDVLGQVSSAGIQGCDAVLIQAGIEDVVRFRDLHASQEEYTRVLHAATRLAPRVIFMGVPDAGLAPAFFPPVSWVYTRRASQLRDMLILACRETGVEYCDLFRPYEDEPLMKNTGRYFAADGLHPSGDGYALWFEALMQQTSLEEALLVR